jgi:hypothetical protein
MSRRSRAASIVLAGTLLAGLAVSVPTAKAAVSANVDISFGARVPINDDHRIFVSINSRYYGRDAYFVDLWSSRFRNPDDLQVFLFMTRHSSASPQYIYDLRRRGMSWFRISQRIHVPMDVFFVQLNGPAYPPFDRVYVRYDRYHRNPHFNMALTDSDVRNLVVFRVMTDYYGLRPEQAMRLRATGRDARFLMVQEYKRRHEHEYRAGYDRDRDHRDSDRDHDHGRGNDRDWDRDHDNNRDQDWDRDQDNDQR